jgi:hypothetical protein
MVKEYARRGIGVRTRSLSGAQSCGAALLSVILSANKPQSAVFWAQADDAKQGWQRPHRGHKAAAATNRHGNS